MNGGLGAADLKLEGVPKSAMCCPVRDLMCKARGVGVKGSSLRTRLGRTSTTLDIVISRAGNSTFDSTVSSV